MNLTIRHRLAVLFLASALLFPACAKPAEDGGGAAAVQTEDLPETDTSLTTVVENGKTDYTLIRPENAEPEELEAAQIIFKAFQDVYGIRIAFETDFVKPGEDPEEPADDPDTVEITLTMTRQEAQLLIRLADNLGWKLAQAAGGVG